jgi:putative membrane protein
LSVGKAEEGGVILGMMGWMAGMMGGMMLWMLLPGLLVLAAIALLVVWAVRRGAGATGGAGQRDAALETLRRRYAAGELSQEQYRRMAKELGAQEPWPQP